MRVKLSFSPRVFFQWLMFLIVFTPLSVLVATRDKSLGTDTEQYYDIISRLFSGGLGYHEPGFEYLVFGIGLIGGSHEFVFGFVFIFVSFFLSFAFFNFAYPWRYERSSIVLFFFLISFLLLSSWFYVAVLNGLRQGMSLALLYFALSLLVHRKFAWFLIFLVVSISFHYSTILVVIFLPLLILRAKRLLVFYFGLALGYVFGINEGVVKYFSVLFGLPVYDYVVSYSSDNPDLVGFNPWLFLYTVFWVFLFYALKWVPGCFREMNREKFFFLKVYMVLCLPYFVFGFGGFSNRYAFIAWLFIPVVQVVFVSLSRFTNSSLVVVSLFFVMASIPVFSVSLLK